MCSVTFLYLEQSEIKIQNIIQNKIDGKAPLVSIDQFLFIVWNIF